MKMRRYIKDEHEFLREVIPGHSHKDIMISFNERFEPITIEQVKAYIKNNRLKTGRTGRFEKGQIPYNKGKSMPTRGRSAETQFKAGNTPHNHLQVGTERLNRGGYWQVKVGESNKWELKQRLEYKKIYGEIPKSCVVIFADRDRNNFDAENLILVTRAQLARMNQHGLIKYQADATKTGIIIADLINKVAEVKESNRKR